jgi:RNA polymerase sigma factor (sigma-70 family)
MADFSNVDELLESLRRGDNDAFSAIYEKYYPRLIVFSYNIVDNEEQAQDIASETLIKLLGRGHLFDTISHVEGFLYLTARNASINYLRYLKTFTETSREFISRNLDDFDVMNYQLDGALLEKLYQSIQRLPDRSREVINYLYIEKLPYQKIAELMETTVKNIENLRAYALKKLKADLIKSGNPESLVTLIALMIHP